MFRVVTLLIVFMLVRCYTFSVAATLPTSLEIAVMICCELYTIKR